ncbi:hypothetical protein ACFMPD_11735 [Sedimentitalea sp. HM32M-2]|uniref:hypothetical protein n=1 Tax=Sedimentitalea sp. HM32M-2 TaxID=3351566 RepID=UPI00362776AC
MPVLLLVLLLGVLAYLYWKHRTSTLSRNCRWRADRTEGGDAYRCVSCGGRTRTEDGRPPRYCIAQLPRDLG